MIEEWAEAASFDAPVPDARAEVTPESVAEAGLAELDRLGWDSYYVVADEFGAAGAVRLAAARPEAVLGVALGHPCLSWEMHGDRAPINEHVYDAFVQLARGDYATFAQHLTQTTRGAYDEGLARQFNELVPQDVTIAMFEHFRRTPQPIGELLATLDAPLLFAEHKDCLLFSREGFEDAVAAFPQAQTISIEGKPSASPEFAEALRTFCAG